MSRDVGLQLQYIGDLEVSVLRLSVVVLVAIWAVAIFTKHTMGGFAHVLLVLALVLGLNHLVRGGSS